MLRICVLARILTIQRPIRLFTKGYTAILWYIDIGFIWLSFSRVSYSAVHVIWPSRIYIFYLSVFFRVTYSRDTWENTAVRMDWETHVSLPTQDRTAHIHLVACFAPRLAQRIAWKHLALSFCRKSELGSLEGAAGTGALPVRAALAAAFPAT